MKLSTDEINEILRKYFYLTNYQSDDPTSPIDPLSYVDSNRDHLIHVASQNGDQRTIELLVRAGIDVDQRGDMGCTALHYARMKQNKELEAFLLSVGASQDIQNDFE